MKLGTHSLGVGAVVITPTGLATRQTFGTDLLTLFLNTVGLPSRQTVGTDVVAVASITINPTGLPSRSRVGSDTIGVGAVSIATVGLHTNQQFGVDTISLNTVFIHPIGLSTRQQFGLTLVVPPDIPQSVLLAYWLQHGGSVIMYLSQAYLVLEDNGIIKFIKIKRGEHAEPMDRTHRWDGVYGPFGHNWRKNT
jgi:hypothetical protein